MTLPADVVRDLSEYLRASPTPYHAADEAARRLRAAGYVPFDEREAWALSAGTRGYLVRGGGTLIAFELGQAPPSEGGFLAVAAHTDSPQLRLKPNAEIESGGVKQLGVEIYGGVLLSTWLDRDLALAGRVALKGASSRLVRLDRALCRVPNLAIHLDREVNRTGLVLNPQRHLVPVVGLGEGEGWGEGQALRERLAEACGEGVRAGDIVSFDLALYDLAGPALGGLDGEFLFSARLDNLTSCHAALTALTSRSAGVAPTRVVVLYDHEEVGSRSAQGAASRLLLSVLERLATAYPGAGAQALPRAVARSLLVSADMAHALHPNYADKYDAKHAPKLGGGPVIKINVNQSYATDAPSAAVFEEACHAAGFAPQRFVSRNDQPCGSTVGPITAAKVALRTVDVGAPMLSMHSAREMCAVADVATMIDALGRVFDAPALPPPEA